MKSILFICHGNICRSPMAEFVMKSLVKKNGLEKEYRIDSAATSREEIGNGIHPGSKRKMQQMGIDYTNHRARQITIDDYNDYDLLIGMDRENLYNMQRILGEDIEGKMHLLLEYSKKNTGKTRDIADPWYTGNFDDTYDDIIEGCSGLLKTLCQ
jgi:protein-tyrosine phosphatase